MKIQICAKVNSISELNYVYTFEPNQHGLYNISLLHRVFNEQKHKLDLADPESMVNKFPEHFQSDKPTSHEIASKMFLDNFADGSDLLLKDSNNDYWGNIDTFAFLLKGASPLYADAVNNLESGNCKSYKDFAIEYSKLHSVYFPCVDSMEGYRAYCIHQISKLFRNLESTYDFTVSMLVSFEQLAKNSNHDYDDVVFQCWKIAFTNVDKLIADLLKFDPQLEDSEGFMLRYRSTIALIKEQVENAFSTPTPAVAVVPPKDSFGYKLGKAFKKLLG
ncbi:hypothetical protein OGA32_000123 [Salmonella enterica]|nr:hypothetical protein [Salmonella enterica]